ncbi:unnamed protein product, partial [Meganyctiphanes norvegica]
WVDDSAVSVDQHINNGAVVTTEPMDDGKRVTVISRLSFTPRRTHNNRTVTCITSNQALSSPLQASISLHVQFPPEVRLSQRPRDLMEGDDATFVCHADANPQIMTYK